MEWESLGEKKRNIRVKGGIDKVQGAEQCPLMPNLLSATFFTFSLGLEAKKRPMFLAWTFCWHPYLYHHYKSIDKRILIRKNGTEIFEKETGCERYWRPFFEININLHKIFKNNNSLMKLSGIVYLHLNFTFSGWNRL
jgi:hypothetical protein